MMHSIDIKAKVGRTLALGALVTALLIAAMLSAAPAHAATTFTVNSTGDKGDLRPGNGECYTGDDLVVQGKECTLRAAIQEANVTPGTDVLEFDIPTIGVATISPTSALPKITKPLTINGYSQTGAKPNTRAMGNDAVLKIELSGTGAPGVDGLLIGAANSTVRGLVINRWDEGIRIDGPAAAGIKVTGNFIGTDATGAQKLGNDSGIRIYQGSNNSIGGSTPAERNVISGNGHSGVSIGDGEGTLAGNKVLGNYIGTDKSGTKAVGNALYGISVEGAPGTTIGGATAGTRNVISGNDQFGVATSGGSGRVIGNFIGTDASGTRDLGNSEEGVSISGPNNAVGGATAAERNVVSGNDDGGIAIQGAAASGNRVTGNLVGTDASGTKDLGNTNSGVYLGSSNNVLGGTMGAQRNVISGNGTAGVLIIGIGSTGNRVLGNLVGTDKNGVADLGNGNSGVVISGAPNNAIGGATAGSRNVVSGNDESGVFIGGADATGNKVLGNYVGTDSSGTKALKNTLQGVYLYDAPGNTVGGATAAERNVISGNNQNGISIFGSYAKGNRVTGNFIGTDASGTRKLGNYLQGVFVYFASNNFVGGPTAAEGNVISNNGGDGVRVFGNSSTENRVLTNSIFSNGALGIDLGGDGPTPDDPGDADAGPNGLQNFPVITSARTGGGTTNINARLNSMPNKTFLVQYFSNPKGTNEGRTLLGSRTVTTDASGNVSFSFSTTKKVFLGQNITSTATGGGNTSEFSAPKAVVAR